MTRVGPYVVTTAEVNLGRYETAVTWGEDGPEIDSFSSGKSFSKGAAEQTHSEILDEVKEAVGPGVAISPFQLPPAA